MQNIKNTVAALLEGHKVSAPPVRVEDIAEDSGVEVVFVDFTEDASEKIHGYYDHAAKIIVVNSADSAEEKQYTIAHELGHHLMHQEYSAGEKYVARMKFHVDKPEEREADEFARRLLLPDAFAPIYCDLFSDKEIRSMFLVTNETLQAAKKEF